MSYMQSRLIVLLISCVVLDYANFATSAQANSPDYGSIQNRGIAGGSDDQGTDLSNQGQQLSKIGKFDEAERLFKAALTYWDNHAPTAPRSLPTCLNNLGLLYANQGRLAEAIPLYRRALELEEKSLPGDDPSIALTLDNLAQSNRLTGQLDEAEGFYKRALAIEDKRMSSDDQDHAITMFNLSMLYLQQGRYEECEPLMTKSLAVLKRTLGANSADYLNVYPYYLTLLRKTNRAQMADELESQLKSGSVH